MSVTVYQYRIYCNTENTFVTGWGTTPPTTCYNNNEHAVNELSIQVIQTVSSDQVTIKEDKIEIARNLAIKQIEFKDVPTNSSQHVEFTFELLYSMYSFKFMADDTNKGDEITIAVNPDTTMGLITQDVKIGDTVIYAPAALILFGYPGFYIKLSDGVNTDDIGFIKNIDKVNGTITVSEPAQHNFSLTNTFAKMTYFTMRDIKIGSAGMYTFGEDVVGGSAVPLNTVVRFTYKNNARLFDLTDEPKSLILYLVLLF